MAAASSAAPALGATIEDLLESLRQIGIIVYDYQRESKPQLIKKLNEGLLKSMRELDAMKDSEPIYVPVELLQYVDEGRNPDLYTRDVLNATLTHSQFSQGKVDALKQFRDLLGAEAAQLFPEEATQVEQLYAAKQDDDTRMDAAPAAPAPTVE